LQFTHLCPGTSLVLDDGTGAAVGYVIGTPDLTVFKAAYPRYVTEVLGSERGRRDVPRPTQVETLEPWSVPGPDGVSVVNETCLAQLAYSVDWLLLKGVAGKAELVADYRAMLHIDLLPPFQRQGWGSKLIQQYVQSVRDAAAARDDAGNPVCDFGKGIHLGVSGENTKVVPFYEKLAFRVYPGGENEGNVWMVRDL
jgi:GNAT superfamily N-acetyltransferase